MTRNGESLRRDIDLTYTEQTGVPGSESLERLGKPLVLKWKEDGYVNQQLPT